VYGFSNTEVQRNMHGAIDFYNSEVARLQGSRSRGDARAAADFLDNDKSKFNWNRSTRSDADRGRRYAWRPDALRVGSYRPFTRQWVYFDRPLNDMVYQLERIFPTPSHTNLGVWVSGTAASSPFLALATELLPNLVLGGAGNPGQYYPRWTYEKVTDVEQGSLLDSAGDVDESGYRRVDNITDGILKLYQDKFGAQVSKDDIFYYVYGVLHSEQYRTTFAADLKRMLPRIPLAAFTADFEAFVEAGQKLADLHVNYESVEPYPLAEQAPLHTMDPWTTYRVEKMKWADKTTKKAIIYNKHVTLGDIPAAAHRYM